MGERSSDQSSDKSSPNAQIAILLCVIVSLLFWGIGLTVWDWERTPDCEAQDANLYASSACGVDDTYVWTGESCTFHCGSMCEGRDCRHTFDDRESCEKTYAHCIDD